MSDSTSGHDRGPTRRASLAERVAGRMAESAARPTQTPLPSVTVPVAAPARSGTATPPGSEDEPVAFQAGGADAVTGEDVGPRPDDPAVDIAKAGEGSVPGQPDSDAGNGKVLHINFKKLQAAGFITPQSGRTGSTEEFRVIKRQLLKGTFDEDGRRRSDNSNVIMVGSSVPGEGKTFTSLNLAMSLSMERDLHVLLVDADNHRHGLSSLLEARHAKVGLMDMLVDKTIQPRDIMLRTDVTNLTFIPAGLPHSHAVEMLASKEMERIMTELATRYPDRLIIIDTPPLLASTEGVAMSSLVGHVIIVVEKNRTTKRALNRALEMLEDCENVSVVLNMETSDHRFSEYTYGY